MSSGLGVVRQEVQSKNLPHAKAFAELSEKEGLMFKLGKDGAKSTTQSCRLEMHYLGHGLRAPVRSSSRVTYPSAPKLAHCRNLRPFSLQEFRGVSQVGCL